MNIDNEITGIIRSLGRIEGKLDAISNLPERVSMLEQWVSWLKGGWAVLAAACAFVFKAIYGK